MKTKHNLSKWKTAVALTVSLCTLSTLPGMAYNQPQEDTTIETHNIEPRSIALDELYALLTIGNSGIARCCGTVSATGGLICNSKLELQQKSGSSWTTIRTWFANGNPITFDCTFYVEHGYNYRLKITADVYNYRGLRIESVIKHSGEVAY